MSDILTEIDMTVEGLCPCGTEPRSGSAYCSPDCEPTHRGPDTDSPMLGGPHAARWRPDLVTAFDDTGLTLLDCHHRDDTGLDYCVYTRSESDRGLLRVDDGHRFVGIEVPWAELEASGPSEPFRRLERELNDARRLDSGAGGEEPDLPPIVCMQCGDLYPSPPPERCSCGLELGRVRTPGARPGGPEPQLLPVGLVAGPDNTMMVRVRGRADLRVRRQLTDEYLMLPGSLEERVDRAWIELQHELRDMLREGSAPPARGPWPDLLRRMGEAFDREVLGDRAGQVRLPTAAERAAAYADLAAAGTVFWLPDPPVNPEAPTMAELAGGVELGDGMLRGDWSVPSRALEPRRDAWEDLHAAWRMLEGLNPAVCFDAGANVVDQLRAQAPRSPAPPSALGGLFDIPIRADATLPPDSWRLEYADGQRLESHVCRWEVSFETGWYRCGLYWPDGHRCESRTEDPATVLRTQWLVGPRSVES